MKKFSLTSGTVGVTYTVSPQSRENLNIRHCHEYYEIIYVMRGEGRYIIEGTEYPLRSGTLLVIPPFAYHCAELNAESSFERWVIAFSRADVFPDVLNMLNQVSSVEEDGCFYSSESLLPSVMAVFDRFETLPSISEEEMSVFLKCLISEILILLSVSKKEKVSRNEGDIAFRVLHYINEHIYKSITLDKLAARFFVSKYYLCRVFKEHNGISIHGYINQKRVMYAKQLIESGETASSAAYKVGFGDYSAFYRAYVKILGKAPTREGGNINNGI